MPATARSAQLWGGLFHCAVVDPAAASLRTALLRALFAQLDSGARGVLPAGSAMQCVASVSIPCHDLEGDWVEEPLFKLCALLAHPLALAATAARYACLLVCVVL